MTTQRFQCGQCGRHDENTFSTVVCRHLAIQPKQFWHAGCPTANEENLLFWPDAWCKQCHQKLIDDGGWDGRLDALHAAPESDRNAMILANMENDRQICNHCYEGGMASSMDAAEKQVHAQWEQFVEECCQTLAEKQNRLNEEFSLHSHERWDVDQTTGQLVFSNGGEPCVLADVEFIGSYSELTRTWLWAWANFHLADNVRSRISMVQEFGDTHALPRLTIRKWRASEQVAWEMAAVATSVLDAPGIYRAPGKNGPVFLAIMAISHLPRSS